MKPQKLDHLTQRGNREDVEYETFIRPDPTRVDEPAARDENEQDQRDENCAGSPIRESGVRQVEFPDCRGYL